MLGILNIVLIYVEIGLSCATFTVDSDNRQVEFMTAPQTFLVEGLQILATTNERTLLACARACTGTSGCAAFAYNRPTCHMMSNAATGTPAFMHSDDFKVFMKPGTYKLLAYRTGDGQTDKPYDIYAGVGTSGYSNISGDFSTSMKNTYKHPIMERWTDFPIQKVYLQLQSSGGVVSVVFNGIGTQNKYDWLTMKRVVRSPWTDMMQGKRYSMMRVSGIANKRFYMSKNHRDCDKGYGWVKMHVSDPIPPVICGARFGRYPVVVYSTLDTAIQWSGIDRLGFASSLAVMVDVKVAKIPTVKVQVKHSPGVKVRVATKRGETDAKTGNELGINLSN